MVCWHLSCLITAKSLRCISERWLIGIQTDAIIWLGDFNYRIGLGSEAVRGLVKKRDFETMYSNDQLNLQMVAGLAFQFYSEARINFMPTYRFDIGTDVYDTS